MIPLRYVPTFTLQPAVENVENYVLGGYHPISIGDVFDQGRFRVLHKLGSGGSSTVWLARDQQEGEEGDGLVALKAMCADCSSLQSPSDIPDIAIPQKLRASLPPSESAGFLTVNHHFFVQGPNGSHSSLVLPLAGPRVSDMSDSPGRTAGSKRLRADLARKVAKDTATRLHHMHNAGIVHGDLTPFNILFRLSPHILEWSDDEVYRNLGDPDTEDVRSNNGQPLGPNVPPALVGHISTFKMTRLSLLQESTVMIDFGQSYVAASPPSSYAPATLSNYRSPEAQFENRAGFEADIWSLACAIFEIRAGFSLFDPFLGSDVDVLRQTVQMLGRLPDPWWSAFAHHFQWFEEDGQLKSVQDQEAAGVFVNVNYRTSIREKVLQIGARDDPLPDGEEEEEGPMIEKHGVRITEGEAKQLTDLLEKMLKYRPEERISIQDVVRHPWFML